MELKTAFTIKVNDVNINGDIFKGADDAGRPGLIICHGIPAGDSPAPANRSGYEELARKFLRAGYNTVIFNFSGTGSSGGNLNLKEWAEQLRAIIAYYRKTEGGDKAPLHLLGFSAGAGVSVEVAASDPEIKSLALCACPANFSFLISLFGEDGLYDWFRKAGFFREPDKMPSKELWVSDMLSIVPEKKVTEIISRKIIFIHGENDDLVPPEHSHRLYGLARGEKRLVLFPGEGHQLRHSPQVIRYLFNWHQS